MRGCTGPRNSSDVLIGEPTASGTPVRSFHWSNRLSRTTAGHEVRVGRILVAKGRMKDVGVGCIRRSPCSHECRLIAE